MGKCSGIFVRFFLEQSAFNSFDVSSHWQTHILEHHISCIKSEFEQLNCLNDDDDGDDDDAPITMDTQAKMKTRKMFITSWNTGMML